MKRLFVRDNNFSPAVTKNLLIAVSESMTLTHLVMSGNSITASDLEDIGRNNGQTFKAVEHLEADLSECDLKRLKLTYPRLSLMRTAQKQTSVLWDDEILRY